MVAASFGINWAILSELIDRRAFESAVAQLIGTAVVAVFNFLSLKLIVYPNVWRKYD